MTTTLTWQQPYVNVFKHFQISNEKNAIKQGEVSCAMDTQIKCTVYKISGATPASNFINIPKSSNNSLNLTGKYFYLLFKPIPNKYFSFHIDVTTHEGIVIRISFSNLFKEFKATSTWLQFPYVIQAPKDSIFEKTESTTKDLSGAAPPTTKWTILCIDLINLTHVYANRTFQSIRSFKLCANMLAKNVITSDSLYEPGVTHAEARVKGGSAFPRELSYPCDKGENWHSIYDFVSFPNESFKKPFDSVGQSRIFGSVAASSDHTESISLFTQQQQQQQQQPKRVTAKQVYTQLLSSASVVPAAIDNLTRPKSSIHSKISTISTELPCVGVESQNGKYNKQVSFSDEKKEDIHVYPSLPKKLKNPLNINKNHLKSKSEENLSIVDLDNESKNKDKINQTSLEPDPIIKLRKVVGFGGITYSNCVLWTRDSQYLIYPCHAVIISYHLTTAQQWPYIGHTDKVSCIALDKESTILVSGQTGNQSIIRFWDFNTRNCLAVCKEHDHSLSLIEFSTNSDILCGVGKDKQGKTMLVMWSTKDIRTKGVTKLLAKAHSDIHIGCIRLLPFDSSRLVSCGRDNIRFWRLKDSSLRSCSVNLSAYSVLENYKENINGTTTTTFDFTDICFDRSQNSSQIYNTNTLYACTKSGQIFEIDYAKMTVKNIRVLEPLIGLNKQKTNEIPYSPLHLNCLSISDSFCVTGSDDGFARLWPLDFKQVFIEAEHESSVSVVQFSPDFSKIATATINGNLGILDVTQKDYIALIRSHVDTILDTSIDPLRKYIATISKDSTIRVWDYESSKQLYDFSAPNEKPTKLSYHPLGVNGESIFSCGFNSGKIRVFNVSQAKLLYELMSPYIKTSFVSENCQITDIIYSKDGKSLLCGDSSLYLHLYDAYRDYTLIRVLPNIISIPGSLCSSSDGKYSAVIGSSDFLITVFETATLNEVLRIDMSSSLNTSVFNNTFNSNFTFESALHIAFAPYELNQIICVTASNKLLKFDAKNGRLISTITNIHRNNTDSISVSSDGKFLVTTGDNGIIKIWDYHMRLDRNYQLFVGHSTNVNKVLFTPDNSGLISVGDALFFWDFLAFNVPEENLNEMPQGRELEELKNLPIKVVRENFNENIIDIKRKNSYQDPFINDYRQVSTLSDYSIDSNNFGVSFEKPRTPPIPANFENDFENEYEIEDTYLNEESLNQPNLNVINEKNQNNLKYDSLPNLVGEKTDDNLVTDVFESNPYYEIKKKNSNKKLPNFVSQRPSAHRHLHTREKNSTIAKHKYSAPPDKCGLKFHSSIGFNGRYSTTNMVWCPESGFFAFTIGSMIIIEDLNNGAQTPLKGHNDDITVLALQNDSLNMASASSLILNNDESQFSSNCQIIIWDTTNLSRFKTLIHKNSFNITCLSYSKDDRFLISVSDFNRPSLVVWSTYSYQITAYVETLINAIHDVIWNPSKCNEFATCGEHQSLSFWILDEKPSNSSLKVHECEIPASIKEQHDNEDFEFTCLSYGLDSLLFAATTHGLITVWDTNTKKCFLNWKAESSEIETLVIIKQRLITGSSKGSLKLWTISSIYDIKRNTSKGIQKLDGLTIDSEIKLQSGIKCCKFDSSLDIGIVATRKGVLWYVNWLDNSTVRLVSTHNDRITSIRCMNDTAISTCSEDGSLRIWSLDDREQIAQFEAKIPASCQTYLNCSNEVFQSITKYARVNKSKNPLIIVGYTDGSIRVFDIDKANIVCKIRPLGNEITAIEALENTTRIVAGSKEGVIAIINIKQNLTTKIFYDHKGAPITTIDSASFRDGEMNYWLAASRDRRISLWHGKVSEERQTMDDWLNFSGSENNNKKISNKNKKPESWLMYPPCLAKFSSKINPDTIIYIGFDINKNIQFYSIKNKKIIRTLSINEWPECMALSIKCNLFAFGTKTRLLQIKDYNEGNFQDYSQHSDTVTSVCFSNDGKRLFSASYNEIFIWNVNI